MKTKMPVVIIFLVAGLLQACAGGGELKHSQAVLKARQAASARRSRSAEALARMAMQNAPNPNSDYIIGPDDLLDIQVYQAKDLSGIVRVDNQNDIELPLTGKISTRGKTPAVLGNELAKRLLKYIKDPFVSVTVKEYRSRKVSVIGAVEHPRIYVMKGQKYLLDMLAEAGGLTPEAGQFCIIMRPEGSPGSQPSTKVINLDKLLDKGDISLNIPVRSGDIINVQKAGMFYVDGEVNKPDAYRLRKNTTLVKAVATAGGLKNDADKIIKIYRDGSSGGRDVITADYDAINRGKQRDVKLAENDIIVVSRSGAKAIIYGLLNTFRGFMNFGNFGVGGGYAQ